MDYPIFLEGEEVGRIRGQWEGGRIEWQAGCPFAEGWIYRLYLQKQDGGEGVYLGVMLPEGKRFVLKKETDKKKLGTLWERDDLQGVILRSRPGEPQQPKQKELPQPRLGCLPFSVSDLEPVTERENFVDAVFAACGGKKVQWEGIDYYLAPGKPGEMLGPAAFFCLLTWIPWMESGWWVLCVGEDDQPFVLRE